MKDIVEFLKLATYLQEPTNEVGLPVGWFQDIGKKMLKKILISGTTFDGMEMSLTLSSLAKKKNLFTKDVAYFHVYDEMSWQENIARYLFLFPNYRLFADGMILDGKPFEFSSDIYSGSSVNECK